MTKHRYELTGYVPQPKDMGNDHLQSALHYTKEQLAKAEFIRDRWCQPSDMEKRQDARIRGQRARIAALEYEINVRLVRGVGRTG